jgi:hypothetical protein
MFKRVNVVMLAIVLPTCSREHHSVNTRKGARRMARDAIKHEKTKQKKALSHLGKVVAAQVQATQLRESRHGAMDGNNFVSGQI